MPEMTLEEAMQAAMHLDAHAGITPRGAWMPSNAKKSIAAAATLPAIHGATRASTSEPHSRAAEQSDGMNSTNRRAAWAGDPRLARAEEHAMRGEVLHAELLLRSVLAEHRDCTPARLAVADYIAPSAGTSRVPCSGCGPRRPMTPTASWASQSHS